MLSKSIVATFAICVSISCFGLETDQYQAWGNELADLADPINQHVNQEFRRQLNVINSSKKKKFKRMSCEEVRHFAMRKAFTGGGLLEHKVEIWMNHELGEHLLPAGHVSTRKAFKDSIYWYPGAVFTYFAPMGHTLNLGGVYIGGDKLAHFFSTGTRYYKKYLKLRKKGKTQAEAYRKVIDYGIFTERTYLGYWPIGTFSFGDLEANFQGLLLNQSMCNGENPRLQKLEGKWTLTRPIDLRNYINSNMDESFNRSFYIGIKWLKFRYTLARKYCGMKNDPQVLARMQNYQENYVDSFNQQYLRELELAGDRRIPDRSKQALEVLCPQWKAKQNKKKD